MFDLKSVKSIFRPPKYVCHKFYYNEDHINNQRDATFYALYC